MRSLSEAEAYNTTAVRLTLTERKGDEKQLVIKGKLVLVVILSGSEESKRHNEKRYFLRQYDKKEKSH